MTMGSANYSVAPQNDPGEFKLDRKPQGWETLGKGFEFFFFCLVILVILYGFATAALLYWRNEDLVQQAKDVNDTENKSVNSPCDQVLRDEDLYPVVHLGGFHERHYLVNFQHNTMPPQQAELMTSERVHSNEELAPVRPPPKCKQASHEMTH